MKLLSTLTLLFGAVASIASAASIPNSQYILQLQQPLTDNNALLGPSDGIENCGDDSDVFHIKSVELTPNPPKRGQPLNIRVRGTLDEAIDAGAYADAIVKLGIIKLVDTRLNLCDETAKIDHPCPIEKGPVDIEHTVDIPNEIPPGRYTILIDATNFDDAHLACIKATFQV
ncbi:ML domain-containing protein [Fimicolochytrium jonesii]|uniref:ML domain-containing protein n=1 Tax=Fimicolochytrium jonesii TaxID=1396493 RepID=UPI0022FEDF53|nr:ML domain-containing protein [Fimicolochytrium jonesii]KAI8822586.1 ML domain-containing protein [Fimicolochytrium jonesii]